MGSELVPKEAFREILNPFSSTDERVEAQIPCCVHIMLLFHTLSNPVSSAVSLQPVKEQMKKAYNLYLTCNVAPVK